MEMEIVIFIMTMILLFYWRMHQILVLNVEIEMDDGILIQTTINAMLAKGNPKILTR